MTKQFKSNKVPTIVAQVVNLFRTRYPHISESVILNMFIAKMAHMFTSKRVYFKEFGTLNIPNHYAMIFIPSGYGKDKMSKEMDNILFNKFNVCIIQLALKELSFQ